MRIFISHSWRDKTTADQLARDLRGMADVWQDIEQLKPGDEIQATIDAAIAEMDLVVVLWSENAERSTGGVIPEIQTSRRLDRPIICCSLDATPRHDELKGTLAVAFDEYGVGFGRLCIVILRHQGASLGLELEDELEAIKDVEGAMHYVHDYRNKKGIGGPGRDHWIERIVAAMNTMYERVTRLKDRLQTAGDFVQQIYGKMEEAGEDRDRLQEILQEVIRNEHLAPDLIPQVRGHIEQYIRSLPEPQQTPPAVQDFGERASTLNRRSGLARDHAEDHAMDHGRRQIEERLRGHYPADAVAMATDLLHHYLSSARQTLEALASVAAASRSPGAAQVTHFLFGYLEEPNDLIPESAHGIWGYLDDAWLIHNTAYRLVESGLVPAAAIPIAWDRIIAADPIATACLPPMVRYELENYLNQLLGILAAEVRAYTPQFAHDGHSYHPNMGQGRAVGGLSREARVMYESVQHSATQASLDGWSASIDADWAASQGGYLID